VKNESSDKTIVHNWHPGKKPVGMLAFFFLFCMGIILLFGGNKAPTIILIFAGIFSLFCGLALFFESKTIINLTSRTLIREQTFLNRFTYWRTSFLLDELQEVVLDQRVADDGGSVIIGLKLISGRKLWVKYFTASANKRCREAEDFAARLSHDLHLPVTQLG
jgi:hypothetical protein